MTGSSRKRRTVAVTISTLVAVALALGYGTYRLIPSRTTQLAGELVQRVDTDERVVALTFDDGPTEADAAAVLDVLAQRGVTATFYLNGREITENPDATQRIIAEGHEVGNHTWSHRSMTFVSYGTVADEVESTDTAIRAAGYEGPITLHPWFGRTSSQEAIGEVIDRLHAQGYRFVTVSELLERRPG